MEYIIIIFFFLCLFARYFNITVDIRNFYFFFRNPLYSDCVFLLKKFFLKKSWISPARLHFHLFSVFVLSRRHCILIRGGGKYLFFHHCVSLISFDIIIIIIEYTWILNFLLNRNEIRAKYKIFGRRREGMKLWKLIDSASIYLKVQCKYVKHNGNTNIKHGKKISSIQVSLSPLSTIVI